MSKFKVDDRVKVISENCCKTYGLQGLVYGYTYGYSGTSYVQVIIDGTKFVNTYNENSLELVNKLNNNKGDNIMTGNFKVAGVKFLSGYNTEKEYDFALYDEDVKIGDTVVCDTVNGFTLGIVSSITSNITNINATESRLNRLNKVTKEIVCKVDMSAFQTRKENRAKVSKLKNMMEKRVKELQDVTLFEMMAEKDDSLKTMLDEYKSLMTL